MYTYSKARKQFYDSKKWKRARDAKIKLARGVCEICGNAGTEVHHKIELTDENLTNPEIALDLKNLQLLCTSCHNMQRPENTKPRQDFYFDEKGNMHFIKEDEN